jgi:DNA-binding NarL/FixJ family response regulator
MAGNATAVSLPCRHEQESRFQEGGLVIAELVSPKRLLDVLLVEDNDAMLRSTWQLLERDFNVVGAVGDGERLVETAMAFAADVIVLDVSLPGINGIEAARLLREAGCPSAIVFLSIHQAPATLRAAMDAGAKAYIVKSQAGRDLVPAILAAARGERYVAQNEHETS